MIVLLSLLSLACSKRKNPSEQRTEPWPAPAASAVATEKRQQHQRSYVLEPEQLVQFELKGRSNNIQGEFPLLRGSIKLDLMDLKQTECKLRIDVGATRITSGTDEENIDYSGVARNWLNVGASMPEATRDRLRWASFLVEEVIEADATAAHDARLVSKGAKPAQPSVRETNLDVAVAAEPGTKAPAEIRSARVKLLGSLQLNDRRVTQNQQVVVEFHYPTPATPGSVPERIVVKSIRPIAVPLSQYQVEPRNAAGVSISSDLKLLGTEVGRIAQLSFSLVFVDTEAHETAAQQ